MDKRSDFEEGQIYMSTPELRDTFERKLALYNRIYKPILGGNAQEELDSSADPALSTSDAE